MKFIPASEGRCFTPAGHDKTVTSRLIYKNTVDIHVTTFPAGAGMAEEVHADFTHLFFVLSGQMEVIQGGKILKTLQAEDAVFCEKNTHDLQFLLHMIRQRIKVFIKVIFLFIGACAAKHYILLIQLSPTFLFSSVSTTFSQVICPIHCRIIAISGEYHLRKCA
mgnify:CR=1 FL=1